MRMLKSVGKVAETPAGRLARPKNHERRVRYSRTESMVPEIADEQFLPPGRKAAVLALRRRLRRVIVNEQAPRT